MGRLSIFILSCCFGWISSPTQAQPVTVQQPTFGVAIDAQGVLSARQIRPDERLALRRQAALAIQNLPNDIRKPSRSRKISLRRLDEALLRQHTNELPPTDAMLHLAGVQRIENIFIYPDEGDIVVAGPAEGWQPDLDDRQIGMQTGRPTLNLLDLAMALRAMNQGTKWVGCTIDPGPSALQRVAEFNRTIPASIPTSARPRAQRNMQVGLTQALGNANVRVFGVKPSTRMARILVAADYRMKRIAIGAEPPPVPMKTFATALRTPPRQQMQRWWLTPDYDGVETNAARTAWRLSGQGVQLQTENYRIASNGQLAAGATPPGRANKLFAQQFTKKYPQIAAVVPVFAELRASIDLLILAAIIQETSLRKRIDWRPQVLLDNTRLNVETSNSPKTAPCVVNAFWKGNRLLAPAGGGVSITPYTAISSQHLKIVTSNDSLPADRTAATPDAAATWWWD